MVGPLPAATVVDVLSSDIEHTVVPREIDFFPVEPGELNCEDELVVFLVQFVVGTGRVVEESGQKPDPLEPGAVGSVGSDTADHLGSSRSLVVFRYEYRLLLLFINRLVRWTVGAALHSILYIIISCIGGPYARLTAERRVEVCPRAIGGTAYTVGYSRVKYFGPPGCRKPSRSYSRQ